MFASSGPLASGLLAVIRMCRCRQAGRSGRRQEAGSSSRRARCCEVCGEKVAVGQTTEGTVTRSPPQHCCGCFPGNLRPKPGSFPATGQPTFIDKLPTDGSDDAVLQRRRCCLCFRKDGTRPRTPRARPITTLRTGRPRGIAQEHPTRHRSPPWRRFLRRPPPLLHPQQRHHQPAPNPPWGRSWARFKRVPNSKRRKQSTNRRPPWLGKSRAHPQLPGEEGHPRRRQRPPDGQQPLRRPVLPEGAVGA